MRRELLSSVPSLVEDMAEARGDWITLEGMVFYGLHGVDPAEKSLGQRFIVDVALQRDLRKPGRTDNLYDTINYAQVYRASWSFGSTCWPKTSSVRSRSGPEKSQITQRAPTWRKASSCAAHSSG